MLRGLVIVAVVACSVPRTAVVVVPTQPLDGHAFVFDVEVNDNPRPLHFELDTGAAASYIDRAVGRELGLVASRQTTVHGAGRDPVTVDQVTGVTFTIGGLQSSGHTVHLADLSGVPGHIDGFLGADFIARHVVTIDYDRGRIAIEDPAAFRYTGSGVVLAIELERGLPFIAGAIKMPGAPEESSRFLIDTGSTDAVDHPAILHATTRVRRITTGVGLGDGTADGVIGFGEYLQLGAYRIASPLTACCGPNPDVARALGTEVLSRFTVVLDYTRHRIILERGARFAAPFPDA